MTRSFATIVPHRDSRYVSTQNMCMRTSWAVMDSNVLSRARDIMAVVLWFMLPCEIGWQAFIMFESMHTSRAYGDSKIG